MAHRAICSTRHCVAAAVQRINIDAVKLTFRSAVRRLGSARQRYLTGQQLIRDALRFLLDLGGNIGQRGDMLGAQDLLETGTEQWPTGLREIEVAPEIEQGALADAGAAAFGTDQAMGEVVFAVGASAGMGAAHEHG